MLIQQVNRTDPEKVYLICTNVDADSITLGYGTAYAIGGNSFDGANVVKSASGTAANLPGFMGVAAQDIPSNGVGRIQKFGFAASVFISNEGTSITINQGDPLVPGALAGGLTSAAPTYANGGFGFVLASNVPAAVSAGGYVSGFVRA